jgi:D-cysteine desulfhydrase
MIEAIKLMASLEGILLDSVYIGKAMAGLIDMVRTGQFEKTKRSYRCAGLIRLA